MEPTATGRQALLRSTSHATQSPVALGHMGHWELTIPAPEQHWPWLLIGLGGGQVFTVQRPVRPQKFPAPSQRTH